MSKETFPFRKVVSTADRIAASPSRYKRVGWHLCEKGTAARTYRPHKPDGQLVNDEVCEACRERGCNTVSAKLKCEWVSLRIDGTKSLPHYAV